MNSQFIHLPFIVQLIISIICTIWILNVFVYSAITDYIRMTLPIHIILFSYIFAFLGTIFTVPKHKIIVNIFISGIVFFIFIICAYFFHSGGGDAILFPLLSLLYGAVSIPIIFGGCIVSGLIYIITKAFQRKPIHLNDEFPLVPGVTILYCIFLIMEVTQLCRMIT